MGGGGLETKTYRAKKFKKGWGEGPMRGRRGGGRVQQFDIFWGI